MVKRVDYTVGTKDKTRAGTRSAANNFARLDRQVAAVGKTLLAVAGIRGFGQMITTAIQTGDQLQKLNIRIGASVEALSQYQHVANQTGVAFNSLTTAWQRQTRRIAEAVQGTGEAKDALIELGLSAIELNRLAPEDQFERIADAMALVPTQADKVRLAMKLWDTEGVALLQTIEGGSNAIHRMRDEANDLGLTMTQLEANELAAANDALGRLKATGQGLARTFAVQLAPGIEFFGNVMSGILKTIIQLGKGLGAIGAAVATLFRGEFAAAGSILRDFRLETVETLREAGRGIAEAWETMQQSSSRANEALRVNAHVQRVNNEQRFAARVALEEQARAQAAAENATRALTKEQADGAETANSYGNAVRNASAAARAFATARAVGAATSLGGAAFGREDGVRTSPGGQYTFFDPIRLPRGFQGVADVAAGGTSALNQPTALAQGERVVSNRTTIEQVNINTNGLPTDRVELRAWVRGVLMPELEAVMS